MNVATADTVRVTEIFYSLQGEARTVGLPTVFVRLTGCPLRCVYCDTAYAFTGGEVMSIDAVVEQVRAWAPRFVTLTGGEPLAQPGARRLLTALCDLGAEVSLETSGAMPIADLDARVSRVMDLKTPASGELDRNDWTNLDSLTPNDQVKFVICDRADYDWARLQLDQHRLAERVGEVLFSPSHGQLAGAQLADWILEDRLPVRLQVQLHKLLWGEVQGR